MVVVDLGGRDDVPENDVCFQAPRHTNEEDDRRVEMMDGERRDLSDALVDRAAFGDGNLPPNVA